VTRRAYRTVMYRIIAALLLTVVQSFSGVALSKDALNGKARLAAISVIGRVTRPKTSRRAASANPQSPPSGLGAVISEQDGSPRKAATLARGPLDLRLPDLRSIQSSLTSQPARAPDSDYMLHVAFVDTSACVGMPARREESSSIQMARTGFESIYLAARHPAQAWRVLLPIVPHDGFAVSEDTRPESEDIRAEAAGVRRSGDQTVCPITKRFDFGDPR